MPRRLHPTMAMAMALEVVAQLALRRADTRCTVWVELADLNPWL